MSVHRSPILHFAEASYDWVDERGRAWACGEEVSGHAIQAHPHGDPVVIEVSESREELVGRAGGDGGHVRKRHTSDSLFIDAERRLRRALGSGEYWYYWRAVTVPLWIESPALRWEGLSDNWLDVDTGKAWVCGRAIGRISPQVPSRSDRIVVRASCRPFYRGIQRGTDFPLYSEARAAIEEAWGDRRSFTRFWWTTWFSSQAERPRADQ